MKRETRNLKREVSYIPSETLTHHLNRQNRGAVRLAACSALLFRAIRVANGPYRQWILEECRPCRYLVTLAEAEWARL